MIFCPSCGAVNAENRDTCEHCGASLAKVDIIVCEACGTRNPSTHRFCMRCGRLIVRPELSTLEQKAEEPSKPVSQPRAVPVTALIVAIIILAFSVLVLLFLFLR